jgi:hypothetical protein
VAWAWLESSGWLDKVGRASRPATLDSVASSPASGLVVTQRDGLGVPPKRDSGPFGRRRRRHYEVSGRQWFSGVCYFTGPFDEASGLSDADRFPRGGRYYGDPPQVHLTATESAFGIISGAPWRLRGSSPLWVRYESIDSVELHPASVAQMRVRFPDTARQLGTVDILTRDHRRAELVGPQVAGLSSFLNEMGATIRS